MSYSKFAFILVIVVVLCFPFFVSGGGNGIELSVGSNKAFINGESVNLDSPPVIVGGRTMVPVRFISEAFGYGVDWDGNTKTVHIEDDDEYPIICDGNELFEELITHIMMAEKSIYIQQEEIDIFVENDLLVPALKNAEKAGVDIKIVIKNRSYSFDFGEKGKNLKYAKTENNITIVDNKYVIIGDHEFVTHHFQSDGGFSLVLKDPTFARQQSAEFLKLWSELKLY